MKDRIKKLRKHLNLSQKAFGEKIGLSESAISNLEKGRYNLTDSNRKLICSTWNVSDTWLDTGEGEMFNTNPDNELAYLMGTLFADGDEFKMNFIHELLKLDDEAWAAIKLFIHKTVAEREKA